MRADPGGKVAGYELTQKGKDLGQVFVAEVVRCQACGRPVRSGEL
ncbi:hypothetical protein AB0B85_26985 [Micromonospora sp. NPDC049044]